MACTRKKLWNGILALTMFAFASFTVPTQAAPLSFDIDGAPGSSVSATLGPSFCFGCAVSTTLNPALDSIAFTLNEGESQTFDFFRIAVRGLGGALIDVSATLGFDVPSGASVVGNGDGGFATIFGVVSGGFLEWNDVPTIVTLLDGSQFSVDFSDVSAFGIGNSAQVTATITALAEAQPSAVPEPTTLSLLGLGLLGFVAGRRRRPAQSVRCTC